MSLEVITAIVLGGTFGVVVGALAARALILALSQGKDNPYTFLNAGDAKDKEPKQ